MNTTPPLQKVQHLMNLALNEGASQEESRTAAVLAIRLIQEHSLIGGPTAADIWPSDLRLHAELKAQFVICNLKMLARQGEYPACNAVATVDLAVSMGEIPAQSRSTFLQYFRTALGVEVHKGVLVSHRGRCGGYQLAGV